MKDLYNPNSNSISVNDSDDIDPSIIFAALWRGKWVIFFNIIFFVSIVYFYVNRVAVPLYSAEATLVLQDEKPEVIRDIESIMSGGPITNVSMNTELEILRSRSFAEKLVDSLDLINHPFFDKSLQNTSMYHRAKINLLKQFDLTFKEPASVPSSEEVRSNVVNLVLSSITISNIRKTLVINISATTSNAALSVLMANTMAELYIENQIQLKLDALANATKFLSNRTSELKQGFEDLKTKLSEYPAQSELVSPEFLETQEMQLHELRTRQDETRERLVKKTALRSTLRLLRDDDNLETLVNTADDYRLNQVILKYQNNLISLDDLNNEVDRFMLQIEMDAQQVSEQLLALEVSKKLLKDQINRQSKELIVLQQLERETETARLLYESFFTRLQEMNVQLGLETADVRLVSEAILKGHTSQNKTQILYLALVFGLVIGASIVVFRELRFSGFRSISELRLNSGYDVLASVPIIPASDRKAFISYLKDNPNSVISEAVRNLRTSILMFDLDQEPQVIMLTSSVPQEGKSVLTFALAHNMVGLGKRVLLIEADIRRRVYSVHIERKNTVSLLDLINGDFELTDLDLFFEDLGFNILTGSKSDINAADIFASQRFADLITELRKHFDYILIDTPPILAVPDARLIGTNSDANIYIVKWNKTTRAQVQQGLDMISNVGIGTTGLVLNQIDSKKMKFYGYTGQYGYDADGSGYYEN